MSRGQDKFLLVPLGRLDLNVDPRLCREPAQGPQMAKTFRMQLGQLLRDLIGAIGEHYAPEKDGSHTLRIFDQRHKLSVSSGEVTSEKTATLLPMRSTKNRPTEPQIAVMIAMATKAVTSLGRSMSDPNG